MIAVSSQYQVLYGTHNNERHIELFDFSFVILLISKTLLIEFWVLFRKNNFLQTFLIFFIVARINQCLPSTLFFHEIFFPFCRLLLTIEGCTHIIFSPFRLQFALGEKWHKKCYMRDTLIRLS